MGSTDFRSWGHIANNRGIGILVVSQPSKLMKGVRFSYPAPNIMIKPKVFVHYQHRYGGLYMVKDIATSTVDKSKWVVYSHVYPFEYETYIRPYDEWCDGRFREIDKEEFSQLTRKGRVEFQTEIAKARAEKS